MIRSIPSLIIHIILEHHTRTSFTYNSAPRRGGIGKSNCECGRIGSYTVVQHRWRTYLNLSVNGLHADAERGVRLFRFDSGAFLPYLPKLIFPGPLGNHEWMKEWMNQKKEGGKDGGLIFSMFCVHFQYAIYNIQYIITQSRFSSLPASALLFFFSSHLPARVRPDLAVLFSRKPADVNAPIDISGSFHIRRDRLSIF